MHEQQLLVFQCTVYVIDSCKRRDIPATLLLKTLCTVASSTVQALHSDQLTPEQLGELQSLVEKNKDRISWHPDDIGKLD